MYTSKAEQAAFSRRLIREPRFLLAHIPAMALAVIRRVGTGAAMAFSKPHLGRKVRPPWLLDGRRTHAAGALAPPTLPVYVRRTCFKNDCTSRIVRNRAAGQDTEDQLAGHRWGFLLERMCHDAVDWNDSIEMCLRWIQDNADTALPAWEPYSACERIANFLVFFAAAPTEVRERGIPPELRGFLRHSVRWVYEHLEYYGPASTNNHILNNARALVLGGIACADAPALSAGLQIFHRCLPQLVLSGGFLRERSSHYQLIVLNWILDAWSFVTAAEGPHNESAGFLAGYAERMRGAAAMLCGNGDSLLAVIGDVSPDLEPVPPTDRLTLLYAGRLSKPSPGAHTFAYSDGWFFLRQDDDLVIGNFPEGEYPWKFPTHGHSDLTGFVWLHGGLGILIDPGRYRYTSDEISLAQIGAAGHNVPTINDLAPLCDSVVEGRGWRPRPYAIARLQAHAAAGGIKLAHDGFARATPVDRHTRQIEFEQGALRVVDSFGGDGVVEVALFWHFGESFERFDIAQMLASGHNGSVRVEVRDNSGAPAGSLTAEVIQGYVSRAYAHAVPSLGIRLSGRVQLPANFVTRFSWLAGAG